MLIFCVLKNVSISDSVSGLSFIGKRTNVRFIRKEGLKEFLVVMLMVAAMGCRRIGFWM